MVLSRIIRFGACVIVAFRVWVNQALCIHSPAEVHFDSSQFGAFTTEAATKIYIQVIV